MTGEKETEKFYEMGAFGLKAFFCSNWVEFFSLPLSILTVFYITTDALETGPNTDSLEEQNAVCGKDIEPCHSLSLSSPGEATFSSKEGKTDYGPIVEQGLCYTSTTSHGYMYLGYDGTCPEREDQGYFLSQEGLELPHSGVHAENSSLVYCMPSYITYAPGQVMAIEGQSLGQQPYLSSAGYLQHTFSYGSEGVPVYSWNSKTGARDRQTGPKVLDDSKTNASSSRPAAPSNSEGLNSVKEKVTVDVKASSKPLDLKLHQPTSSTNFPGRPIKPLNRAPQLSSGIQPVGIAKGYHNSAKISSLSNQGHSGLFPGNNFTRYRSFCQTVDSNGCFQMSQKLNLHKTYEPSSELVRGPRANVVKNSFSSSAVKDSLGPFICRDQFNKPDFQLKYEHAKFFMIKSYSEDDIHKSIKYNVWASTPNGNNKLDAAFRDAEMEKNEKGMKSPIFLFFSVNASGQFVGLAEMTGLVDFKKNMDFWQQDKWNGFFPVTWHIIKDIPNRLFQNITLENNDNKPVTFSRDTQEIKLPQGLKMLQIFKSFPVGTSILDDFDFYENRENSLRTIRSDWLPSTPSNVDFSDDSSLKHLDAAFGKMSMSARPSKPHSVPQYSPTILTRSPLLNCPPESRR